MVVHSALAVLLTRLSGTSDIVVGTPVAGRGEQALDDLVGMFVNTLVLRTEVDGGARFTDVLSRVRETDLQAFGHADVPFERLVEVLNPARSQARHPLFQVALGFQNLGQTSLELPGLSVTSMDADVAIAKFDLQFTFAEVVGEEGRTAGLAAEITYATDLFDEATVAGFAARLIRIVDAVTSDPAVVVGDIDILGTGEQRALTAVCGSTATRNATLAQILSEAAAVDGDAEALRFEGRSVTYRELDDLSSRWARVLIGRGVGPDDVVAIAVPRSIESVVAIWAGREGGCRFRSGRSELSG